MNDPFTFGCIAVLAGCAAVAVAAFAYARPRQALIASYLLLTVANTKFRLRSATDSLAGDVDSQIALELGLYGCIALILVTNLALGQTPRRRLAPMELLLVSFGALALISSLWSSAPSLTVVRALQMLIVCALALTSVRLLGPIDTFRCVSAALVTYVLGCAAIAVVVGTGTASDQSFRFSWFNVHPILAGIYAALAALLVLTRRLDANRTVWQWKLFPALILVSLVGVLVLTNSRGPVLAFVAAAGLVIWKTMRRGFTRGLIAFAGVFVLAVALSGDAIGSLLEQSGAGQSIVAQRILRGSDINGLRGLNGRVELWEAAAPLIAERPLTGYGYHGARALLFERVSWGSYAHSAYVQTLLDFGILGALLVWGLIGSAFIRLALSPLGAVTGIVWCDASLTAIAAFTLIISVSSESFIAVADFEALLIFLVVSLVGQSYPSVQRFVRRPRLYGRSWARADRRAGGFASATRSGFEP